MIFLRGISHVCLACEGRSKPPARIQFQRCVHVCLLAAQVFLYNIKLRVSKTGMFHFDFMTEKWHHSNHFHCQLVDSGASFRLPKYTVQRASQQNGNKSYNLKVHPPTPYSAVKFKLWQDEINKKWSSLDFCYLSPAYISSSSTATAAAANTARPIVRAFLWRHSPYVIFLMVRVTFHPRPLFRLRLLAACFRFTLPLSWSSWGHGVNPHIPASPANETHIKRITQMRGKRMKIPSQALR